jgi:MOSC domain-containing protein YiiM
MASVLAVHRSSSHSFSKFAEDAVTLVPGLGVQGDAHAGATVQHRSRVARDPSQPNLRQVHLLHAELFDALLASGFAVWPGDLGENITTRGVDLLALAAGEVQAGDPIRIELPSGGARPLEPV